MRSTTHVAFPPVSPLRLGVFHRAFGGKESMLFLPHGRLSCVNDRPRTWGKNYLQGRPSHTRNPKAEAVEVPKFHGSIYQYTCSDVREVLGGVGFCSGAVEEGWWRTGGLSGSPFSLPAIQCILHKDVDRGGEVNLADPETLASPGQLGSCLVLPGSLILGHLLGSGGGTGMEREK